MRIRMAMHLPSVSMYLRRIMVLTSLGPICCFRYPESARYTDIETAGPTRLKAADIVGRVLLLAWPDTDVETSQFGYQCLMNYQGPTVIHVGELYGGTMGDYIYGQTTSADCQHILTKVFRRVHTDNLPRWPGHLDELTVWRRVIGPLVKVDDEGAELWHMAYPQ